VSVYCSESELNPEDLGIELKTENSPPEFDYQIPVQAVILGEDWSLKLPNISDDDSDSIIIDVDLGLAGVFVQYNKDT